MLDFEVVEFLNGDFKIDEGFIFFMFKFSFKGLLGKCFIKIDVEFLLSMLVFRYFFVICIIFIKLNIVKV